MDEKQLKTTLSAVKAPPPSEQAREAAFAAALAAYDIDVAANGGGEGHAAGDTTSPKFHVRGPWAVAGRGAMAVCGLAVILGGYYMLSGGTDEVLNSSHVADSGAVKDAGIGQTAADETYTKKLVAQNQKEAREAMASNGSFMPKPVSGVRSLALKAPYTPPPPPGDPLSVYRAKTEASVEAQKQPAPAQVAENAPQGAVPAGYGGTLAMDRMVPSFDGTPLDEHPAPAQDGIRKVVDYPVSTFPADVDTGSYSFVRRMIEGGHLPPAAAVRTEELVNYFPYDYAAPGAGPHPFRATVAVYACPWKPADKLVHIGLKASVSAARMHSNIVFLIDTSGSMDETDRLPLIVNAFKLMLDSLQPDDTVGIVTYAGKAGIGLEPTKVADRDKIVRVLDGLIAEGETAGYDGLNAAYGLAEKNLVKDGNNRIILATDGDFNVGISDPAKLEDFVAHKSDTGVVLSVLGVGRSMYRHAVMRALAKSGNGTAAYIDNLRDAGRIVAEEARGTPRTVAKDVKIQVEFNPAAVKEYRLIGWEARPLNADFDDDRAADGKVGAGHSVTALYEITPANAPGVADTLKTLAAGKPVAKTAAAAEKSLFADELAFLKVNYKLPAADTGSLLREPISPTDEKLFADQPDDIRFAASVAGFGQLLRDDKFADKMSWDQLIDMASDAKGKDESGDLSEFVNLLKLARTEARAERSPAAAAPVQDK